MKTEGISEVQLTEISSVFFLVGTTRPCRTHESQRSCVPATPLQEKKKKKKSVVSILALVWLLGGIEALSWLLTFETKTLFLE